MAMIGCGGDEDVIGPGMDRMEMSTSATNPFALGARSAVYIGIVIATCKLSVERSLAIEALLCESM